MAKLLIHHPRLDVAVLLRVLTAAPQRQGAAALSAVLSIRHTSPTINGCH